MDTLTLPGTETMNLSAAELAALALSLAHLGAGPQAVTARRALARLVPDERQARSFATLLDPLDSETARRVRLLAQAITESRVVRVLYADERGKVSRREVEPVTTLVHGDHWYLVGWCRLRHGIRAFRLDRIMAVEPTEMQSRPHRADGFLPFQGRRAAA
ncbi:helix-turn-helix transcriptional regulator [Actinocorallia populi]|uniref:helix-turn-helix transcriptional regulator n=1 Tax=Actinocorallia populi TaxID=2079200 RepID=UPI000D089174|nr:WYL domain-containing protein [Actinocorallia populi]